MAANACASKRRIKRCKRVRTNTAAVDILPYSCIMQFPFALAFSLLRFYFCLIIPREVLLSRTQEKRSSCRLLLSLDLWTLRESFHVVAGPFLFFRNNATPLSPVQMYAIPIRFYPPPSKLHILYHSWNLPMLNVILRPCARAYFYFQTNKNETKY